MLTEVRCCCNPTNLMGHVSEHLGIAAGLGLRELDDDTVAFSGEGLGHKQIAAIPGFTPADTRGLHKKGGKKTWKK